MTVIIGTSGWQYRDWRGAFYPQKLAQRLWLEHYVRVLRHGREQQRVLPAARAGDVRGVAGPHARRLPVGGQGQPLPHPHQAAARAGGAGGPADGACRRPRREARHDPAAAPADAEGRSRPAAASASPSSRPAPGSPSSRGTTAGGPTRSATCSSGTGRRCAGPTANEQPLSPRSGGPPTGATCGSITASRHGGTGRGRCGCGPSAWPRRGTADQDVLVYFNNDPGCAAVIDAVLFAEEVRRTGREPTRVPPA